MKNCNRFIHNLITINKVWLSAFININMYEFKVKYSKKRSREEFYSIICFKKIMG